MQAPDLARFETAAGRTLYRLPVLVFEEMWANAYLVTGGAAPVLVDCGSGLGSSDEDLARGFETVGERFGERVRPEDLGAIVITHGHIDHFGGLGFLRRRTSAPILVHVLDRRVLSHYEERVVVASQRVRAFLRSAGVGEERLEQYMALYLSTKGLFRSVEVEQSFEEGPLLDGELYAHHVPGHCPGQVCVGVDDLLLTADHLLETVSPPLSPESITSSTGLRHYLASLDKVERLEGYRLGLGGHQGPIRDLARRARTLRALHERRLARVLEHCDTPRSILEISRELFGRARSYHILLALLETGALVEYLYQRGELVAANVEEIETAAVPVIRYRRER
jgi:glyoxylase-like metal-dependent hydrolase (beta-lactamase superfamily II)